MYGIWAKLYRGNNINVCNDFGNWWSGLSLRCICLSSKHSEQNPFRFLTSRHDKRVKEECSLMGPWIIVSYRTIAKTVTASYCNSVTEATLGNSISRHFPCSGIQHGWPLGWNPTHEYFNSRYQVQLTKKWYGTAVLNILFCVI